MSEIIKIKANDLQTARVAATYLDIKYADRALCGARVKTAKAKHFEEDGCSWYSVTYEATVEVI